MTSKQALATALAALGAVFGRAVTPELVDAYALVLGELSASELALATKAALSVCRFFPTPAELLEHAGRGGARLLAAETAEAWGAVMLAKRRHDYTTSVNFGPLVNAVIANMGGWLRLCDRTLDELVWDRKKFEELYAALRTKVPSNAPAFLRGAFGGVVVPVAIAGKVPPMALPERDNGIPAVVRELAQAKGGTP
jgi:hypothetical protein